MALSTKQRVWLESYLRTWNATEAARLAGYKDPEQAGYENKRKQEVQTKIQEHIDEIYPAGKVLSRLADHADGTMADFIDVAQEDLDMAKAEKAGKLHLIKKFTRAETKYGTNVSIELYDAQSALVHLGKHHGLFTDKVEHSGPDGAPIQIEDARSQLAARLARFAVEPDASADPGGDS